MVRPLPLHEMIGARVRELREGRGILQEDVAARARDAGFDWVRGTVAMIESGRRRLTLEEFFYLSKILETAGAGDLWLKDLLPQSGHALLTPLSSVAVDVLHAMLLGVSRLGDSDPSGMPVQDVPESPSVAEVRALWRRWWPKHPVDEGTIYKVALASRGDAEVKAARTLGVAPVAVALQAYGKWDRSLTEERDARVVEQSAGSEISARTLQALRGHVTRQIVDELRPLFKRGAAAKSTAPRKR